MQWNWILNTQTEANRQVISCHPPWFSRHINDEIQERKLVECLDYSSFFGFKVKYSPCWGTLVFNIFRQVLIGAFSLQKKHCEPRHLFLPVTRLHWEVLSLTNVTDKETQAVHAVSSRFLSEPARWTFGWRCLEVRQIFFPLDEGRWVFSPRSILWGSDQLDGELDEFSWTGATKRWNS